jgi:GH35 family endo-1,4-beta-xylanase
MKIKQIASILLTSFAILLLDIIGGHAQMGKCKGKYLGSAIQYSSTSGAGLNFNTYWNQCTAENGSKWGSVESTRGQFNWETSDYGYNWAKNNNGLFKYHNFVWGSQTPAWVNVASVTMIQEEVENYIKACSTHYTPMGGLKLIDVVNEPVKTALIGNYKAALTAGYEADPANKNDLNNQYGWIIWPYQLARKYHPDAKLLMNEYGIENDPNGALVTYCAMINAVKNAPNITDGRKNLIDGVGLQCHAFSLQNPDLSASAFKSALDKVYTLMDLPIHITELDLDGPDSSQNSQYQALFPVAWEHPHVAGITLLGYVDGQTWRTGRTDNGLITSSGTEHSAMTWMKSYMASQPDIAGCPLPGTYGPGWGNGPVTDLEGESAVSKGLSVYPNPFQYDLTITGGNTFEYSIYDMRGSLVEKSENENTAFSVGSKLQTGLYVVKMTSVQGPKFVKVTKN